MPAAALAALLALPLAACTAPHAKPTPTATSASTPLFSSDEEALKAATDAYAAYLKMSDTISHDGGANPERIKPYVTASQYERELKGFSSFRSHGVHTTGSTSFDSLQVEKLSRSTIDAYVCVNSAHVRVLNDQGQDITPSGRPERMPFEVGFNAQGESHVLLSRSETWSGKNFC
jgi:hypothetical protein